MSSRAHECLESARTCEILATQARDPLVKAGLQEAARHWRERAKRLEQQLVAEIDRAKASPRSTNGERAGKLRGHGG
jgi:hypothetical protein